MKQSEILRYGDLSIVDIIVRNESFKAVNTRDSYAHFAKTNYHLAMGLIKSQDSCAHLYDCFECLSPHKITS